MKHYDIREAKSVYADGGNVTQHMRKSLNCDRNTTQIIELAYDLQAGSYIKAFKENMEQARQKARERIPLISPYLTPQKRVLDVGTGELTSLSLLLKELSEPVAKVFAFDISWSRLHLGRQFANEYLGDEASYIVPFVADIGDIPLASNSMDIVTSSHALEPNGKNLGQLLSELFRVCREKLVLFEPSYELNSEAGRVRMDSLGYIKDIEGEVAALGGKLLSVTPQKISDPMNPTVCYVVEPPYAGAFDRSVTDVKSYTVPGTDYELERRSDCLFSKDTGLAFPVLRGIPILSSDAAVLATALN